MLRESSTRTRGRRTLPQPAAAVNDLAHGLLEYPRVMAFYLFALLTMAYLWLVGARRRRLRIGRTSLVYYEVGPADGEPWLLLHGLGSVAAAWGPVMRRLRRDCRLIVPELSELGGSEIDGGAAGGLGPMEGVEVIVRLLAERFGGRPVTVCGLSLGGWLATRLALAHPELVARLALVDAGGYRDQDWGGIERLVRVKDLAGVASLYGALFARVPWM